MKIKMCEEFFYRVTNGVNNLYEEFNSCKDNILRNNNTLNFYNGEWIKIRLNDYTTHTVKPMETIKKIADQYNLYEEKLMVDNNLKNDKIFIGQRLKIYK